GQANARRCLQGGPARPRARRGGGGLARPGRRGLARMSAFPRRGEVYWVALDPTLGTEIQKTRPAIVLSNDSCNRHGARVVVVPVTGNVGATYPGEAEIELRGRLSRALGDQIRSIDKARLRGKVGRLTPDEIAAVEEAVRITLDL